MNPFLDTLLASALTSGAAYTALRFLGGEWIAVRVRESVAAEYRKALEIFKGEQEWQARRREQAVQIAGLLDLYMRAGYAKPDEVNPMREELQRKYWELALWLDLPVLLELNACMTGKGQPGLQRRHPRALSTPPNAPE